MRRRPSNGSGLLTTAVGLMLAAALTFAATPVTPLARAHASAPKNLTHAAESLVAGRLARIASHRHVTCARLHIAHAGESLRWICTWTGLRHRGAQRCDGTYRVALQGRTWNLKPNAYRCGAKRRTPAPFGFGFNDNSVGQGLVSPATDAALNSEVGANVVRLTVAWDAVEAKQGQYRFGTYDQIYSAMRARGIKPLLILLWAPRWAWPPGTFCLSLLSYCRFPPGTDHVADAARMAALLAKRYPAAAGIEIWNEPNLSIFWRPQPDPGAFAILLRSCYLAIKRVNPAMPVVMGGLSNLPESGNGNMSLHDFLQNIYVHGARSSTDAIAFHPYPAPADPTLFMRSFADVRALRHAYGDDTKPLWITELGISTSNSVFPISEVQQAAGLIAAYRDLAAMPDVRMIIFHTLIEYGSPSSADYGYGLLRPDLSPKLGFCALGKLRASLFSCNA